MKKYLVIITLFFISTSLYAMETELSEVVQTYQPLSLTATTAKWMAAHAYNGTNLPMLQKLKSTVPPEVYNNVAHEYLDTQRWRKVTSLTGHTDSVKALTTLDPDTIASGSWGGSVRIWDLTTGQTRQVLTGHTDSVKALTTLDPDTIASGSWDGTVRIWDLTTGQTRQVLTGPSRVKALTTLDPHTIASGSSDGTVRIWHTQTLEERIEELEKEKTT